MRCPKCGEEIDHLINTCNEDMYKVTLVNNKLEFDELESFSGDTYLCPECEAIITADYHEAFKL